MIFEEKSEEKTILVTLFDTDGGRGYQTPNLSIHSRDIQKN